MPSSTSRPGLAGPEGGDHPRPEPPPARPTVQIFLRTVYPLNPGIPHYVDFPRARR
jgi:hypothetical protein